MSKKSYPKNILVVKNRAMGDSIMGLSTISYIKSVYKNANVFYGLPKWIIPLYSKVATQVDKFINIDLNGLSDWTRLWGELRENNIDMVMELNQRGSSAKFFTVYSLLTRTPYFFHNHNVEKSKKVHIVDQGKRKPNIQRDLDGMWSVLQQKYDLNKEIPSYLEFPPIVKTSMKDKKQVVFGVVATRRTKMWPLEHYKELADHILSLDSEVEILIPLSPSETDNIIKQVLINNGLDKRVKFVHASLADLPIELSGASYYIGNDTGIKHLCISMGMKTWTFFGPEEPLEWHPYNEDKHQYFFRDQLPCRTEISHYCPLNTCESMICLNDFKPADVYNSLKDQLVFS